MLPLCANIFTIRSGMASIFTDRQDHPARRGGPQIGGEISARRGGSARVCHLNAIPGPQFHPARYETISRIFQNYRAVLLFQFREFLRRRGNVVGAA